MGDIWTFFSNMNRGELDPLLVGRIDLAAYYNGVATADNVLSIPQGGLKKRPGQEYLATALDNGRLENFSFNVEQNYLLVFTPLRMQIFKDGVLQTNINGSGNDYLVTTYTASQIEEFDYIQSADTVIITHPDVAPKKITRTSDTSWTITTISLSNVPQFDFNDGSSPTPVDEIQSVFITNDSTGDRFKISLEGILTEEIVVNEQDYTVTANDMQEALLQLPNTGNSGITVVDTTPLGTFTITFSGESANDWDNVSITPVLTASSAFVGTTTKTQAGTSRREDTWSSTRGWPVSCTFHEGRLWFGGSKSRPATIWGSVVADFFNFKTYRAFDDESVEATIDSDQVNAVQAVFSNRSLQIFTSGGEFYIPESPITPGNIAVLPQSNLGTKRIRPVSLEGITLFAQRTGKAIIQFVFINEFQANQSKSVSLLSPHLINDPKKLAVSRGSERSDANYIYILNEDGTLTVFNSLIGEDVSGFTRWGSSGEIKSIAVVDDEVYLLTEREINSSTVYLIEKENELIYTDAAVRDTGLASDTLTGLNHLEGEEVDVKADGAYQGTYTVSSGQITIGRTADTIEAGLAYRPNIVTLPLNMQLQNGPNASSKKKIGRVSLQLYESNGVTVNGRQIADKTIGQNQFDAPTPNTGIERIFLPGWSLEAQITVSQATPMPFTILNIGAEVKV